MDEPGIPLAFYLVFPGALLLIALIATIIVLATRRRPLDGMGLRLTEPRPDGTRGLVGGTWNAMIHAENVFGAMGGSLGAQDGRLELADGVLTFLPAGATTPAWSVPCTQLGVARGLARPVRLVGPMGTLTCTVSHEHINRFSQNTLKDLREQRYANEFVTALQSYGARPA
jgi:hypothetical protein